PNFSIDVSGGVSFKFDVTIPTYANIVMDQAAILERLAVETDGFLVGNPGMVIRTDLLNSGFIDELAGVVQRDFVNTGRALVTGSLDLHGQLIKRGSMLLNSSVLQLHQNV